MGTGPKKKGRKLGRVAEALLLDTDIHIPNAPTLRGMLSGWKEATDKLKFSFEHNTIPKGISIE